MFREISASLRGVIATLVVCTVIYPLVLLAFAMVAAPEKRMGSIVHDESGKPIGSRLVAQGFTQPQYFWPRPSAVDYNAAGAGGSNLSPLSPQIRERAEDIIARLELAQGAKVPAELVTASGGGLDPHVTLAGALVQVPRVARARQVEEQTITQVVERIAAEESAGPPGGERLVNVLLVNIALNREFPLVPTTP
jgi:K+-transporting ATPase ATPase C chain